MCPRAAPWVCAYSAEAEGRPVAVGTAKWLPGLAATGSTMSPAGGQPFYAAAWKFRALLGPSGAERPGTPAPGRNGNDLIHRGMDRARHRKRAGPRERDGDRGITRELLVEGGIGIALAVAALSHGVGGFVLVAVLDLVTHLDREFLRDELNPVVTTDGPPTSELLLGGVPPGTPVAGWAALQPPG